MIKTDLYSIRSDGVRLYRSYSDADMMIRKSGTDELYCEAVDIEGSVYAYSETDIPVPEENQITLEDTMSMLGELGVDIDD